MVSAAQFVVLGDLVNLDLGFDPHFAPQAHDGLDHLIVLGLEALGGLDLELDRVINAIARCRQQGDGCIRIIGRFDRRIVSVIFWRLQRVDRHAVARQQAIHDGLFVNRGHSGFAHVGVGHHFDVVQEDHPDVGHGRCIGVHIALQAVVFFIGHFQRDMAGPAFNLGHTGGGVGHELDRHRVKVRLAAPVVGIGLQAHKGVLFELFHHIGAGANRGLFKPFRAHCGVICLGQHIAGQEIHPLKDRGVELFDIGRNRVAIHREIGKRGPDEVDRVAGFGVGGALKAPCHVFGGKGRTVVPSHAFAHGHVHLGLVIVPAPFGQQTGGGFQVGLLQDELVKHRLVQALNGRVHRRGACGRIP